MYDLGQPIVSAVDNLGEPFLWVTTYSMTVPPFAKAQWRFLTCMVVDYLIIILVYCLWEAWSSRLHQIVVAVDHTYSTVQKQSLLPGQTGNLVVPWRIHLLAQSGNYYNMGRTYPN